MQQSLRIIEVIAEAGEVSLRDLHQRTQIPLTSLHRQLGQLRKSGYVQKIQHGQYRIGPVLVRLAASIMNHAAESRYKPLLQRLVDKTGLNAELYAITRDGPVMICWIGGKSEFQVRMFPGFHLSSIGHPAVAFYKACYPKTQTIWGAPFQFTTLSREEWEGWVKAAEEQNFIIERKRIRPELARLCVLTPDRQYCIGLSGLISEFTLPDETLRQIVHTELNNIIKH
ncbi:MAG: winged helix-turn-helix transcriptional regulator [Lentisphaerae bacterium]|nr:MAG: winged helix-turn-helix transcriptional regulator [Lentisphaerota bacterium]